MGLQSGAETDATERPGAREAVPPNRRVAIEVDGLQKSFRIPTERVSRLKERLINPLARQSHRRLDALSDISFEVADGEFFGIVGRNGSGKSTLLKILASIYAADGGRVRMAGTVAPFIELGVGFDMELTARENVVLNAVMMGLSPIEARRRFDKVIEFAELEEFVDLKLKNYSSGMLVRLAFSVMVQADTDILLIDEVLAVGDAAFQQKCSDEFHRMKAAGKTIVLVTHDMRTVEQYCHRAMLLSKGALVEIGDPREVARRYLRLNFEEERGESEDLEEDPEKAEDLRLLDIWLEDAHGGRIRNIEQGEPIRLRARLETRREVPDPEFGFVIANADNVNVHEFLATLPASDTATPRLLPGQSVTVSMNAKNDLVPGHYYVHHGAARNRSRYDTAFFTPHVLGFVVFGKNDTSGLVSTDYEMQVVTEESEPA